MAANHVFVPIIQIWKDLGPLCFWNHGQSFFNRPPHRPCLGPPDPWFRVKARSRRSRPDQVDYWEGVLHILYIKSCLKIIDHGSRSTWGPGPSGSGFRKASLLHGADREICCLGSAPLRVTIVIAYDLAPCKIRPPYQIWWGLSRSFCWTRRTRTVSNREPLTRFWTARWWKYELMDPARRYKSRANYGK